MIVVADLGDNEMRKKKKKDSGLGQTHPLPKETSDWKVLQGQEVGIGDSGGAKPGQRSRQMALQVHPGLTSKTKHRVTAFSVLAFLTASLLFFSLSHGITF